MYVLAATVADFIHVIGLSDPELLNGFAFFSSCNALHDDIFYLEVKMKFGHKR